MYTVKTIRPIPTDYRETWQWEGYAAVVQRFRIQNTSIGGLVVIVDGLTKVVDPRRQQCMTTADMMKATESVLDWSLIRAQEAEAKPEAEWRSKTCPTCQSQVQYVGEREFRGDLYDAVRHAVDAIETASMYGGRGGLDALSKRLRDALAKHAKGGADA